MADSVFLGNGDVNGPASAVSGNVAVFDGTTGKLIKDGGLVAGTVTSVSVTTANGVSGSVATPTTTPAITLTLGAITPSTVATTGSVGIGTAVSASYRLSLLGDGSNLAANIASGGALPANIGLVRTTSSAGAGVGVGNISTYNGANRVVDFGGYSASAADAGEFEVWTKATSPGTITLNLTVGNTGDVTVHTGNALVPLGKLLVGIPWGTVPGAKVHAVDNTSGEDWQNVELAVGSSSVPVPALSVGPTKIRTNPTSGCSTRHVSTMRFSAALVAVYTPSPGHTVPTLATDDR